MRANIVCPVCTAKLPVYEKHTADVTTGLTTTLDDSYVNEHLAMHEACTCSWPDGAHQRDPLCTVHGVLV
jgi:hypothetical protein